MKNRNLFWGLFFLLSAVFLIATQTGSFVNVGVLSIVASLLLLAIIIHSLINLNFFGVFVPIPFLYIIYQKPLALVDISIWVLLLTSALISIGFSIIFRSQPKKIMHHCYDGHENFKQTSETIDDNHPYVKVNFGASSKYLHSDCLESGQFITSFGAIEVFFDQAQLSPNGAEIFLECNFGAIKLFVPKHWKVQDSLNANLGGVDNDTGHAQPVENAPHLKLTGNVQFGGIEIKYI